MQLDEIEQQIIANCANLESTHRRMWSVVFTALTFVILLSYAQFALSHDTVFIIMLVYVVITTIEKLFYGKGVLIYKKLITKFHDELVREKKKG